MDNLERDIKNKLAQSETMKGVDSESLWTAISAASNGGAATKKKGRFGFLWLFLSVFTVGLAWSYVNRHPALVSAYTPRKQGEVSQLLNAISEDQTAESLKVEKQETTVSTAQNIGSITEESLNTEESTSSAKNNNTTSRTDIASTSQTAETGNDEESEANFEAANESGTLTASNGDNADPIDTFTRQRYPAYDSGDDYYDQLSAIKNELKGSLTPLTPIEPKAASLPERGSLLYFDGMVSEYSKEKTVSWNLYSGAVFVRNNFAEGAPGFADTLNTNLNTEIGYHLGATVRLKEGKNWLLKAGMEYSIWNDRFDKVLLSDTLIVLEEGEVIGQNIRTVRHFNSASVVTFPVQFGVFADVNRFRFGLDLGASYSIVFGQNGRMLGDVSTVVDYSQNDKRFKNFVSARVTPNVGFKFSEKIMINALCPIGVQGHGTNVLNDLKSRSIAVMPSLGLTFNY